MPQAYKPIGGAWFSASVLAFVLLGACAAYVAGDMLVTAVRLHKSDPLDDPALGKMKTDLRDRPGDDALKTQIRQLDLRLREDYFAAEQRLRYGGWALLALGAGVLGAGQLVRLARRKAPHPEKAQPQSVLATSQLARIAVAVFALLVITGGALLGHYWPAWIAPVKPVVNKPPQVTPEEFAANSFTFRGPGGCGVASNFKNVPDDWDVPTGRNILWKAPISLPGQSSPVVWGKRVFLTAADKSTRTVLCLDADTGTVLWQKDVENVPGSPPPPANESEIEDAGWAAPTPVCDGRNVYAIFGNMDLACFTLDGDELWKKNLGPFKSSYGYGSSLAWCDGKLIFLIDQGDEGEDKSRILALADDGKVLWETKRPVMQAWTSPVVIDTPAGKRIVTAGHPWVMAYDTGGKEVWRAKVNDAGDVAVSPACAGGVVFVANEGNKAAAIKADSSGDVTDKYMWSAESDVFSLPGTASPLADGKYVYLASGSALVCVEAGTGKRLYEENLHEGFYASPTLVGDRIYLPSQKGTVFIFQAGPVFKQIAKLSMGEGEVCNATPAFADGRIFIRGKNMLYCIGIGAAK